MSESSDEHGFNLRAEMDRIDRMREEGLTFAAEQHTLAAGAKTFGRDGWFLIVGAIIAALASRLPEILHAFGLP